MKLRKVQIFGIIVTALFLSFAAVTNTQWGTASAVQSITQLATLKQLAQSATPYETALSNGKSTLIEFYANWCTTCQAMAPTLDQLHEEYNDRINFVMLNVDQPQWAGQVKQYQVTGVPHWVVLNSYQDVVFTEVGKVPKQILEQAFDHAALDFHGK
ncbi:MAG: thioredoxin domain-containing protein [Microcoleaceae cyanobacterium]